MVDPVSLFVGFNVYAFAVAHLTQMFRDHHGVEKGFLLGNVVVFGTLVLALLFVYSKGIL